MEKIIVLPNRRLDIVDSLIGVEEENVSSEIIFEIPRIVGNQDLDSYVSDVLILLQNEDFLDEILLDSKTLSEDENFVYASWIVERKDLLIPSILIQVKIADSVLDKVWLTEQRTLSVLPFIPAEEEISNTYPTILTQLRQEVNALANIVNSISENYLSYK